MTTPAVSPAPTFVELVAEAVADELGPELAAVELDARTLARELAEQRRLVGELRQTVAELVAFRAEVEPLYRAAVDMMANPPMMLRPLLGRLAELG